MKKKASKWLKPTLWAIFVVVIVVLTGYGVWGFISWMDEHNQKTEIVDEPPVEVDPEPEVIPIATKEELLVEVNKRRAEAGVAPLQYSPELERSAQAKCDDMVARNYYGHINPDGINGTQFAINATGWRGYFGENLLMQAVPDDSAESAFDAWFSSQGHKDAALNEKYILTGFGICGDTTPNSYANPTYFVEHFYSPTNLE